MFLLKQEKNAAANKRHEELMAMLSASHKLEAERNTAIKDFVNCFKSLVNQQEKDTYLETQQQFRPPGYHRTFQNW